MKHMGTRELESDRLILRRFSLDDDKAMYNNWANDPEVTKYLRWPHHETVDISRMVLEDWTSQYGRAGYYQWAIVLKGNGKEPIGCIGVVGSDEATKMVHIGYCLGKRWWRQGIMSEALALLVKFFFEEVGMNRVESQHDPKNPNSGKVMVKCGLQYEGTRRDADWSNQGICDSAMYAILAKDYKSL